jgi:hypothetical protein
MRARTLTRNSLLIVLALAVACAALCTQLGIHPLIRPNHFANDVSSLFDEEGHCKGGVGGAHLQSAVEPEKHLYLCFIEAGRIGLWITINKMAKDCLSRDCTRFFTEPNYIRNTIAKWGYRLIEQSNAPEWFVKIFAGG